MKHFPWTMQRVGLLGCWLLACGAAKTHAAELALEYAFPPENVVLETLADGYTRVDLKDGVFAGVTPGASRLPTVLGQALIPAGAKVSGIRVEGKEELLAENVTIVPQQARHPKSRPAGAWVGPAPVIYALTTPFPAVQAEWTGTHSMRGYSLVSFRLNPLRYIGASRQLWLCPKMRVIIEYTAPRAATTSEYPANALFDTMVRSLVDNPDQVEAMAPAQRAAAPKGPTIQYLLITRAALTNAFKELETYRAARFSTTMLTVEFITNTYSGADAQIRIRTCIKNYVTNNATEYVVLGGDNTIVPVRGCYAKVDTDIETAMPTDLYYSGLDGTWNADGDSTYGETNDVVDMTPDVVVGRIPVRTAAQATAYINKLKSFESNPTRQNGRMLLGGMYAWDTYTGTGRPSDNSVTNSDYHAGFRDAAHTTVSDSEMWARRLYRDGIRPYWIATNQIAIFCDTLTTWDPTPGSGNFPQNATNLLAKFNLGWFHMFFSGHGDYTLWGLETGNFTASNAGAMTGTIVFAYTDACLTGGFDDTTDPCLSEAFLRNASGGSLIYIGCSRYGWGEPDPPPASNTSDGGPSTVYGYKFYRRLHETSRLVGNAFALHKADMIPLCSTYDCERWIQFGLNLQGDPVLSTEPTSGLPPALQPVADKTVTAGKALSFFVTATESEGDITRLGASSLPGGATFAGATGTVSVSGTFNWTPASTGSYSATFFAADKDGTNSLTVGISVTPPSPPTLATDPSGATQSIVVGNAYALTVQASENDGDTVTITNVTLPAGATFKATNGLAPLQAVMSWTPSATGTYSAAFRASDKDGAVTARVQLVVTEAPSLVDIGGWRVRQTNSVLNFTLPTNTYIAAGGYLVIGRNATKELFESFWGVTLGANVTYINSGDKMPQLNGAEQYLLYAADGSLKEGPTPSAINPTNSSVQRINAQSNAMLAASWAVGASSTATPGSGCSGNGTAGLVISEYADASSYSYEFVELYYDGGGGAPVNYAPIINVSGGTNRSISVSNLLAFTVTASDPESHNVNLSASSLPSGATFPTADGASPQESTFSWTPSAAGSFEVLFVARDKVDNMATTQRVTITVSSGGSASYVVNFEGAGETKNSYAAANVTLNGVVWNLNDSLIGTDTSDRKNGARASRTRNTGDLTMQADKADGCGTVSLKHGLYGTDASCSARVDFSTNNGVSWVEAGSFTASSTNLTDYSVAINQPGAVRIRIVKTSGGSARINIDDITLSGYAGGLPAYYTDWAGGYGIDPNGEDGGMNDDYDGDGSLNIDECIGGSDPTNPDSRFAIAEAPKLSGAQCAIAVSAVTGRIYSVYFKDSLTNGDWVLDRAFTNISGGLQNLVVTNAADQRFYRVGVRRP